MTCAIGDPLGLDDLESLIKMTTKLSSRHTANSTLPYISVTRSSPNEQLKPPSIVFITAISGVFHFRLSVKQNGHSIGPAGRMSPTLNLEQVHKAAHCDAVCDQPAASRLSSVTDWIDRKPSGFAK